MNCHPCIFWPISSDREQSFISKVDFITYRSITQVPSKEWDRLVPTHHFSLRRMYLAALESSSNHAEAQWYIMLYYEDVAIGIAHFSLRDFHGPSISTLINTNSPILSRTMRALSIGVQAMNTKILVCGSSSASWGPSLAVSPRLTEFGITTGQIMGSLNKAIDCILAEPALKDKVAAIVLEGGDILQPYDHDLSGFTQLVTEPMMHLSIDPRWKTFEMYLESLTSKYRIKARKADSLSSDLRITHLNSSVLNEQKADLSRLYESVTHRAPICIKSELIDALIHLSGSYPDHFTVYGYYLGDQLIGFRTSAINQNGLSAQIVGINYTVNKKYGLYPRMLNDYIREAIENRCATVYFGRTAGEIKSTLGAVPQRSSIYLRHLNPFLNHALPFLASRTQPNADKIHFPFKKSRS